MDKEINFFLIFPQASTVRGRFELVCKQTNENRIMTVWWKNSYQMI